APRRQTSRPLSLTRIACCVYPSRVARFETLTVALGDRSYPIHFGSGLGPVLADAVKEACASGRRLAVITDTNVRDASRSWLEGPMIDLPLWVVPAGEKSKSIAALGEVCEFLA